MFRLRIGGRGPTLAGFALTCSACMTGGFTLSARAGPCAPPAANSTSYTANGCDAVISGGTFNSGSTQGAAVLHAINGGTITVTGPVSLFSTGDSSTGGYANNSGSIDFGNTASVISVTGAHSNGVHAFQSGATITGSVDITTSGERAHGAFVDYGGVISLYDSVIVTTGYQAAGVAVATGSFTLTGPSSVTTTGDTSPGLAETSTNSSIVVDAGSGRTSVRTTGQASSGVAVDSSGTITLHGVDVQTQGNLSTGLIAANPGASIVADGNSTVTTLGTGAIGGQALAGGNLTLSGGSVTTSGTGATGLVAAGSGSTIAAQGTRISTGGASADGIDVSDGAQLTLGNGAVAASGTNAHALRLAGAGAATTQMANIAGSTLDSSLGAAIDVLDGSAVVHLLGGEASGVQLLTVESVTRPAQIALFADGAVLSGAALMTGPANGGASAQLTLTNGAQWTITGDSVLTSLVNVNSRVAFALPSGSGFHTLTVGNLAGSGATLTMDSALGGDASPSDRLVIDGGTATGTTAVRFLNAGGKGAVTIIGIPVIEVANGGSAPPGAFTQLGRAVAGPYEYRLFRASNDGDWYLGSQRFLPPPTPPTPPNPPSPPGPPPSPPNPPGPTPPVPLYRPEVSVYFANEYAASTMFIQSLRDRMPDVQGSEANALASGGGAWLRLAGTNQQGSGPADSYSARTNSVVLQGGGDIVQRPLFTDNDRLHVGAMAGYGNAQSEGYAAGNEARASGSVEGYSGGVYATWFANAATHLGPYVDSWLQYAWFSDDVDGEDLPGVHYHTQRLLASLESGWTFALDPHWRIEPQTQLIWVHQYGTSVTEPNGTELGAGIGDDWVSRLGVRIVRSIELANGTLLQPHLTLNWWHDTSRSPMDFSGVTLSQIAPSNRYEARIGFESAWAARWSVQGDIGAQWGADGYRQYALRLAARFTW